MKVLVTGGSGFIGRHAVAALAAAGSDVHVLTRLPRAPAAGVHWHRGDFTRAEERARVLHGVRPTHVLHAAWFVEHGAFWEAPVNDDWTGWTIAFAREAQDAGVRRFVGVGSCAEYDWTGPGATLPRGESDAVAPATRYGRAKLAAWQGAQDAATTMGVAWARLFHLYGPGEPAARLVPTVIAALRERRSPRLGPGGYVRDFMAVEDAGAALAAVLGADVDGAVNVASGRGAAVAEVVDILAGQLCQGARPPVEWGSASAADIPVMLADTGKLRSTGFRCAWTLEAGLRRMCNA